MLHYVPWRHTQKQKTHLAHSHDDLASRMVFGPSWRGVFFPLVTQIIHGGLALWGVVKAHPSFGDHWYFPGGISEHLYFYPSHSRTLRGEYRAAVGTGSIGKGRAWPVNSPSLERVPEALQCWRSELPLSWSCWVFYFVWGVFCFTKSAVNIYVFGHSVSGKYSRIVFLKIIFKMLSLIIDSKA